MPRLATAAVAYRGRQPLSVCSIELVDLIAIAYDRGGDSRRAVDFPVGDKGQIPANVLLAELMNALRRIVGHGETENPSAFGRGRCGCGDIARALNRPIGCSRERR